MIAEVDSPVIEEVSEEPGEVGNVLDSRSELILSGKASQKIPYMLTNQHAHRGMLPEFLPFFANCGTRKHRELLIISMAIKFRLNPTLRPPPKGCLSLNQCGHGRR